jgi:hypothetical protein
MGDERHTADGDGGHHGAGVGWLRVDRLHGAVAPSRGGGTPSTSCLESRRKYFRRNSRC